MARRILVAAILLVGMCGRVYAASAGNLWLDVPFIQQEKNGCGPASIAMVMQYWQKQPGFAAESFANPAEIVRALQPDERQGVRASQMVDYFKRNGYQAFAFAGTWSDLESELAKGRPVIAALKPDAGDSLHYVVVAGINDGEKVILLNDPAQRKLLKEDRTSFEREWKVTGFWMLLAVPADGKAPAH